LTCALTPTLVSPTETQVWTLPLEEPYPQLFVEADAAWGAIVTTAMTVTASTDRTAIPRATRLLIWPMLIQRSSP
jgi:hypothetical protein